MILKYIKKTLLLYVIMSVHFFYAQNIPPSKHKQLAYGQIDYLPIKMPDNEINMGFVGIHYNAMMNNWSYGGVGFYGAVSGIRGGFFTLGINLGIQHKITENIFIDTGVHFGGGGGASAPDGGGAFILPHINLGYKFNHFSISSGYSYINFFDKGNINNSQIYASVQIPLSFDYASFKQRETSFLSKDLKNSKWEQKANKISLFIHTNNLSVKGKSKFSNGTNIKGKIIRLAGFELNSYLNNNIFFFVKADGAYHGIPAGYMDIFIGGGYHFSMNKNKTNILAKFGVGAGGGGGVDTQGGFLIYPDLSIEQKLFNNIYISINKGYLMNPNLNFVSNTLGLGLKYYVDKDGLNTYKHKFNKIIFKGIETIIKQELYFNANRNNNFKKNMYQISLQINLFLNRYIYGAGQTSFANFGDAGAYAEGIIGLGFRTNSFFYNKLSVFTQVLGGSAGGGGISTGQGFIVKPSIGINYYLSDKLNLKGSLGYVKANGGKLNSTFLNIGLSYNFAFLSAKN